MYKQLFIGVDGGASKTKIRVEDDSGQLIAQACGGPSSIKLSVTEAWANIENTLLKVLQPLAIDLYRPTVSLQVGMGLAGCEVQTAYTAFLQKKHSFTTLIVSSDSHIACLGAHGGKDGAVIIAGTGVVGYQLYRGEGQQVGGWGFPFDDQGGGAWLGLHAVKIALQWLDGRSLASSQLAQAIYAFFANNKMTLVEWANQANATAFAELAPIVIHQASLGEREAQALLQQGAQALMQIGEALDWHMQQKGLSPLPLVCVGSIAQYLQSYLPQNWQARLQPCRFPPEAGAIFLVQQAIKQKVMRCQ